MKFDPRALSLELEGLSTRKRAALAASICQRLIPNYEIFFRHSSWGDPRPLQEGLQALWTFVSADRVARDEIQRLISEVDSVTPQPGEFKSDYASAALDSAAAIQQSLAFMLEPDADKIVEVASFARDTVDMFLQIRYDINYGEPDFEKRIAEHPLMMAELQRQSAALDWLLQQDLTGPETVKEFRAVAGADARIIPLEGQEEDLEEGSGDGL